MGGHVRTRVTVSFDRIWGGAVASVIWDYLGNQVEFINDYDPGRLMQSAIFEDHNFINNPTEGGDYVVNGSPVTELTASGQSAYGRTLPLQWKPDINRGAPPGGPDMPVLWGGEFEKRAIFDSGFDLDPSFVPICWRVGFKPIETTTWVEREWLTAYVEPDVSNVFYKWTPTGGFTVLPNPPPEGGLKETIGTGGIFAASSASGNPVYGLGIVNWGPIELGWFDFSGQPGEAATRKIRVQDLNKQMAAGQWYRNTMAVIVLDLADLSAAHAKMTSYFENPCTIYVTGS